MINQSAMPASQGLHAFLIIWIGQLISLVGSQLTAFALGVWVYDQTKSVSLLALTQIAFFAPQVLLLCWSQRSNMVAPTALCSWAKR